MKINKMTIFSGIFAAGAGCFFVAILLTTLSKNPLTALSSFITGSFRSKYYFGTMLNTASLFMTAGLGSAIALKGGLLNLGGEGQIYAGGFVTAIILNAFSAQGNTGTLPIILALVSSLIAGSTMTLISAILKEKRSAAELLTTFLFSAAVIPFIDSAITDHFRTTEGNLIATPFIASQFRLPHLLAPSPFNSSFFIAIVLCLIGAFSIFYTKPGRHLQIWGTAPEFARYCGYISYKNTYTALSLSGAFHGLTGFFAVCGTYYTCHTGFYSGIGWDALSCALISGAHPGFLIPVSLILSWIFTSADRVSLIENFGFDISGLIQGVLLFCISFHFVMKKRSLKKQKGDLK